MATIHGDLRAKTRESEPNLSLALLMTVALFYAAYFVLRFGGLWSENDTGVFSNITTRMLSAGSVLFTGQYVHGYAYPAWLGSLSLLTGLSVPVLSTVVTPFVGVVFLLFFAYLAYCQWLNTPWMAMMGVLLLFGAPDLLFGVLRGNHEKLTLLLSLAAFYALMRGIQSIGNQHIGEYLAWALVLYLSVFTNATVNDYFASTFVAATSVALAVGTWLMKRSRNEPRIHPAFRRLTLVVAASWLLIVWVMFFVFPPAGTDFQLLRHAITKLLSLFLTFHAGSNPYTLAKSQWANPTIVTLVAAFRWTISLASFFIWIAALWQVIVRKHRLSWSRILLIGLYGAFGLTIAVAIPVDFTGLGAGTNLEVRNFTFFVLFASPLLVWGMSEGPAGSLTRRLGAYRALVGILAPAMLVGFIVIGLFKVTLDPIVSNQWMFYRPSEKQSVSFFWAHARDSSLWTGPDNRIRDIWNTLATTDPHNNSIVGYAIHDRERDWLRSPVVIANTVAQGMAIPNYLAQDRVFDAGGAQIYHVRPLTMFQN